MTLKVVIVDSNPADREILRRMLNSSDLEVDMVEIVQACDFLPLALADFDCALIDCRLPDRDGIETLAEVCQGKSYPPCPMIIMSGPGDEHTAARAFKAGANDYLIKDSMTPNILRRTVVNAIDKWHAEDAMRNDWESQRHALRNAERANIAKTQFISSLSHQLRIPLTTIIGFSELIESAGRGDEREAWDTYKDYAADIGRSARELLELMNGIIDLARIENGDMPIAATSFDPRRALHDVIESFSEHANNAHVGLNVDDHKAPRLMVSDDRAVMVIMANLLSNAIKASPAGREVQVQLLELEDGTCRFSVTDCGVGMNPADVQNLMRPFERYHPQVTSSGNELGVGLPLVSSLVQTLGGNITFDTTPGEGTTATVVLPHLVADSIPS